MEFRRLEDGPRPALEKVALRDIHNRPALRPGTGSSETADAPVVAASLPAKLELVGARPNQFGQATEIVFRLPSR